MSKLIVSVVLFLNLIVIGQASADVYLVDIQRVLAESNAGKSAKKLLDSKFSPVKNKLEEDRKSLVKMQADIRSQSALLSADAMNKKVESFREKEKQTAETMQKYQQDFSSENNKKLKAIMDELREILDDIADDLSAKLILEKSPQLVLYYSDDHDITDKVISELNKKDIRF